MCTACVVSRRLFCAGLLTAACLAPEAPLEPRMRLAAPDGPLTVALTLDACPGGFDERIATTLVEAAIPATIFATGVWLRENPAGLAFLRAHRDIFAIENHGEQHIPPVLGTRPVYGLRPAADMAAVKREVANGASSILEKTGTVVRWYRGAAALYSPACLAEIQHDGARIGAFTFSADDGASLPAERVAARIAAAKNGDVIIGHINQPHRASGHGIATGVRTLQARGAVFVHLADRATIAA